MPDYSPLGLRAISVPSIINDYTDAELNSGYHSKVEYEEAVEKYGAIYKVVDFNDLTKKADIEKAAKEWIRQHYFDGVLSFNVKAVDLHMLGFNKDKIKVGDRVTVEFLDLYKVPVRKTLTCLSAQIDLLNPGNSSYKIGIPDTSMSAKFRYTNNRGSVGSSRKSSDTVSSTGGGVNALYKLYKELEDNASITADKIDLISQQLNVESANQTYLSEGVMGLQSSVVIQNAAEINNVVGSFIIKDNYYDDWPLWDPEYIEHGHFYKRGERVRYYDGSGNVHGYICIQDVPRAPLIHPTDTNYWTEVVGRRGVELIDGAAFELDDYNGARITVGKKLQDHDDHFATYDGSALWTQREHIVGVAGEYDIYTDPTTGKKTLIILSGGGIKIKRDETEFGLYDEDNLQGGILVDKINTVNWSPWEKNSYYPAGAKVSYHGFGYVCKVGHTSGNSFDSSKWERYTATNTKILGERVDIQADQLVAIGVYTDKTLTGGMIVEKVNTPNQWYSGVLYKVGDRVQYDGATYKCIEEHTSEVTFDSTKWTSYHATKIDFKQLDSNVSDYTAMGLFDNDTLTGGILVEKINGTGTVTKIYGNRIMTGDSYVEGYMSADALHFYEDSAMTREITAQKGPLYGNRNNDKVYTWNGSKYVETSETLGLRLSNMDGLIAEKATIGQLNAQIARINTIEADYITADNLSVNIANITTQLSSWDARFYRAKASDFVILGSDSQGHETTASVKTFIKEIQISDPVNNVYTLQYKTYSDSDWQNAGTFSRATTLSGAWSSGTLTVTASPQNEKFVRSIVQKTPSWDGNAVTIPIYAQYGSSGQYEEDTGRTVYVDCSSKLEDKGTVTSNGTYTPSSGKIGISSIKVNVETSDIANAKARFNAASGSYYIEAYDNRYGTAIANSSITYKLATSGSTSSTKVIVTNASGTQISSTPSLPVGSLYTDGVNSVTVTDVSIYGTPAATATSISVQATASNGATKIGSIGITTQRNNAYNSGGATAKVNQSTQTLGYGGSVTVTAQYVNASGTTVNTSSSCTISAPADNKGTGWTLAVGKVSLPGAGTDASMSVTTPTSTYNTSGSTSYSVSADNTYAYIKQGSTVVARNAHSAYSNGVNSVTVTDVSIYGSPAATATEISVQATASNGATKIGSIGITTQRNNAYNSGHNEVSGSDIILSSTAGSGVGTESTTEPSSSVTKKTSGISGYVWLKETGKSTTTYKNLRTFSLSLAYTRYSSSKVTLYYKSGSSYYQAGNGSYYWYYSNTNYSS